MYEKAAGYYYVSRIYLLLSRKNSLSCEYSDAYLKRAWDSWVRAHECMKQGRKQECLQLYFHRIPTEIKALIQNLTGLTPFHVIAACWYDNIRYSARENIFYEILKCNSWVGPSRTLWAGGLHGYAFSRQLDTTRKSVVVDDVESEMTMSEEQYIEDLLQRVSGLELINKADHDRWTPLYAAVLNGNKDFAKLLVRHHAFLVKDVFWRMPLHWASQHGALHAIRFILYAPDIMINTHLQGKMPEDPIGLLERDIYGLTPGDLLQVQCPNAELYVRSYGRYSLARGENVVPARHIQNGFEHEDEHASFLFLIRNFYKILEKFLQRQSLSPLYVAIARQDLKDLECVLQSGVDVNYSLDDEFTPLYMAVAFNWKEGVNRLLEHPDMQVTPRESVLLTPLMRAVMDKNDYCVELLLKAGGDIQEITDSDMSLMHLAALTGSALIITLLKGCSLSRDLELRTPLHRAAQLGHYDAARALLDLDTELLQLNSQDVHGLTPLHLAVDGGHSEIVDLLLTYGADKTLRDHIRSGYTPIQPAESLGYGAIMRNLGGKDISVTNTRDYQLYEASKRGQVDYVAQLLQQGARLSWQNDLSRRTALHEAVLRGEIGIVKLLLRENEPARLNIQDVDGFTALHVAVMVRDQAVGVALAEKLLAQGARADRASNHGWTALHIAVANGKLGIVELLLSTDVSLMHIADSTGNTALHSVSCGPQLLIVYELHYKTGMHAKSVDSSLKDRVAISKAAKVTKKLLEKGANISATNRLGFTALHAAVAIKYDAVVDELLKWDHAQKTRIIDVMNRDGAAALHLATGDSNIMALLLDYGASRNMQDRDHRTPVHVAAQNGNRESLGLLLKRCENVSDLIDYQDINRETTLHLAARMGYHSIVSLLLAAGASADIGNVDCETPLHVAVRNGCSKVIIDVRNEYLEVVKEFLRYAKIGILMKATDREGNTVLHEAVMRSTDADVSMVMVLLESGYCSPLLNRKNRGGFTPLHFAVIGGDIGIMQLLLKAGARPQSMTFKKVTPLHLACKMRRGADEGVKVLLESLDPQSSRALVNVSDIDGNTPLHYVAMYCSSHSSKNYRSLIETLLSMGARITVTNKEGKSPSDIAQESNSNPEILQLWRR